MKKKVDVSLLVTNYNNGKYLEEFFESVINSTVQPAEIIFVDDGSSDNSISEINKFQNKLSNLNLIIFEKNKGRAEALNIGKSACESKYILIIDPDDILLPKRIEKQFNFMENNPEIDVLGANVEYFLEDISNPLNLSNFPISDLEIKKTYKNGENGLLQPTIIIKAEILKKYDYKNIRPGQDYELFARIAKDGYIFGGLKEPVNKMRVHKKSAVSTAKFSAFKQIFAERDKIFGTKTSIFKIKTYFWHIKFYRLSMFETNKLKKIAYIFIASIAYPSKIFKRIFGN